MRLRSRRSFLIAFVALVLVTLSFIAMNLDGRIFRLLQFLGENSSSGNFQFDLSQRSSSGIMRTVYEYLYILEVLKGGWPQILFGGTTFDTRTASLNSFTEILIRFGVVGLLAFALLIGDLVRRQKLSLVQLGGLFLLFCYSGAIFKWFFWFMFFFLIKAFGENSDT